jgi:anti-anti-sigma factor
LAAGHDLIVLDLADVTFLDCSALRAIDDLASEASGRGVRLALENVPALTAHVLELTGLDWNLAARGTTVSIRPSL